MKRGNHLSLFRHYGKLCLYRRTSFVPIAEMQRTWFSCNARGCNDRGSAVYVYMQRHSTVLPRYKSSFVSHFNKECQMSRTSQNFPSESRGKGVKVNSTTVPSDGATQPMRPTRTEQCFHSYSYFQNEVVKVLLVSHAWL